jgi:multiple sugar transport system substrate-binding protein
MDVVMEAGPMSRRQFLQAGMAAAAMASGASILAACGQAASPPGAPAVRGTTEITYWTFLDPKAKNGRSEAQNQMIAAFEKKYPQYRVHIEIAPWQTVDQQLIQATQAGKGPDVALLYSGRLGRHVQAGSILPLDRYLTNWSSADKADWIVPWDATVWNGKKMAFFADQRVMILAYRADWLKAAGFTHPPRSWAEAGEMGGRITASPRWGYIASLSQAEAAAGFEEFFVPMLLGFGGQLLGPNDEPTFNSPEAAKALQFLADLVYRYRASPESCVSVTADNQTDGLKAGTYGMAVLGSHRITTIQAGAGVGDNLRTAPVPSPDGSRPSPAIAAGQTYAIAKTSRNPEAAWRFIEHMISAPMEVINAKLGGQMPPRKSAYDDPWFKTPQAAQIVSWKEYMVDSGVPYQFPVRFADVARVLAGAAEQVVAQRVSPDRALAAAASQWKSNA